MSALLNIVSSLAYGTAFAGVLFLIPAIQELKNSQKPHNGEFPFTILILNFAYFVALFLLNLVHKTFETSFIFSAVCLVMFSYFIIVYQRTGNRQVKQSVHHQLVILVSVVFGGMAALQIMPQHHQQTVIVTSAVSLSFIGNGYPIVFVVPKSSIDTLDLISTFNGAFSSILWYIFGYLTNDHVTVFASVVNTFLTSYWLYLVLRPVLFKQEEHVSVKQRKLVKHKNKSKARKTKGD